MSDPHPAALAEQQRRWLRPNAHLYWRPDAARFLPAHLHHLLPPQLLPSPQDGGDRARPNIAQWTGRRGRWTPERAARERAEQECQEALEQRQATAERLALCELKSAIAKLRFDIAFEHFKRAALRWAIAQHLLRKAGFRPDQPRWPAGSGRISGRWSGGAGTGASNHAGSAKPSFRLAADITGFTRHGINAAINRRVSPGAILDAVTRPIQIVPQPNGTTRYIGRNAVVVLNPAGQVVTVWGQ